MSLMLKHQKFFPLKTTHSKTKKYKKEHYVTKSLFQIFLEKHKLQKKKELKEKMSIENLYIKIERNMFCKFFSLLKIRKLFQFKRF